MMEKAASYRMQIEWNAKTVEWFWRASAYTGFHKKLAEILSERIDPTQSICDLGCGAGLIDFELRQQVKHITCIDKNPDVIRILQSQIRNQKIENMQARCADIYHLDGQWDIALMVFVGGCVDHIGEYLRLCRDKLILVNRGGCVNNPSVSRLAREHHSLVPITNQIFEAGIQCRMQDFTLEYGQPFSSKKEAFEYVDFYHKNSKNESVFTYLEHNLVKTKDKEYPFYLPSQKHFGVFEIKKDENLHLLK